MLKLLFSSHCKIYIHSTEWFEKNTDLRVTCEKVPSEGQINPKNLAFANCMSTAAFSTASIKNTSNSPFPSLWHPETLCCQYGFLLNSWIGVFCTSHFQVTHSYIEMAEICNSVESNYKLTRLFHYCQLQGGVIAFPGSCLLRKPNPSLWFLNKLIRVPEYLKTKYFTHMGC